MCGVSGGVRLGDWWRHVAIICVMTMKGFAQSSCWHSMHISREADFASNATKIIIYTERFRSQFWSFLISISSLHWPGRKQGYTQIRGGPASLTSCCGIVVLPRPLFVPMYLFSALDRTAIYYILQLPRGERRTPIRLGSMVSSVRGLNNLLEMH